MKNDDQTLINEWLDECRAESTRISYTRCIAEFQAWYGKPLSTFLKLDMKDMRHIALCFQNDMRQKHGKINTTIGYMTALGSFCNSNGKPLPLRGKRLRIQIDLDSHVFTNGDLTKMFDIGNTQEKAMLATFVSLGWEVSAILELQRPHIKSLIEKAKQDGEQYVYFRDQRKKTGALRLGVLNPLAIQWIGEWLKVPEEQIVRLGRRSLRKNEWNPDSLFGFTTKEGVNHMLKRLARDAHVTTTGRIHTHLIRKWVMSGLSRAGFNEFQIKFCMGKTIPLSDMTYLQTLEEEIKTRYPKAFEQYLNIKPAKIVEIVDLEKEKQRTKEIQDLHAQIGRLENVVRRLASNPEKQFSEETIQDMLSEQTEHEDPLMKRLPKEYVAKS